MFADPGRDSLTSVALQFSALAMAGPRVSNPTLYRFQFLVIDDG